MATPSPPKRKLRRFLIARHGETNFNKEKRVQGTSDVSVLTPEGHSQAAALGAYIARRQAGQVEDDIHVHVDKFDDAADNGGGIGIEVSSSGVAQPQTAPLIGTAAPPIRRTWCSPLNRCRQTYNAISNQQCTTLPTPTIHHDLREIELCEWQNRLRDEVKEEHAANWKMFMKYPQKLRLNDGQFAPVVDCWERGVKNWEVIRSDAAAKINPPNKNENNNNEATTQTRNEKEQEDTNEENEEEGAILIVAHGAIGHCMLLNSIGFPIESYGKSRKRYMFDNCECVEIEWADGKKSCERWRRVHPVANEWMSGEASRGLDGVGGGGLSCGR